MSDFHKRKEEARKNRVYTMTQAQIDAMKKDAIDQAIEQAFVLMLCFPVEVLANEYWEKTAKKRIPHFVDSCISLYEAYAQGVVDLDQMFNDVEQLSGIKIMDRAKARRRT